MDQLTTKATPEGTLSYTYNAIGKLATIASSNSNGMSVAYTYDSQDRLSTVVDNRLPTGHNATTYTYDPSSNVATATCPNTLKMLATAALNVWFVRVARFKPLRQFGSGHHPATTGCDRTVVLFSSRRQLIASADQ
jgi:YD repeat-containing protein